VEDTPDDFIHDFFEKTFWNGHPLGLPILGTKETVVSFEREILVNFFTERYTGENVTLTAAGNLKHDVLVNLAKNTFGSLEGKPIKEVYLKPLITPAVAAIEKDLEQEHIIVGTTAPSSTSQLRYPALLMNIVLGGSMSSRLFQEIREKRGLAYSIRSYLVPYRDAGILGIYVATSEDKVKDVIGLILEELDKFRENLLTEKELHSAKELVKGNLLLSMESTDNRMTKLAKNEILFGRNIPVEEIVRNIEAVSREDIKNLAGDIFSFDTISLAALGKVSEKDITEGLISGGNKSIH